jgi:hypothetical protein
MDDKDKSVIGKLVDTVTSAVGGVVKAAVMPTHDTDAEAVAEKTNEQMFLGDAAIAPEAIPAPTAPKTIAKRSSAPPAPKKSAKEVARAAKTPAKKSRKTVPKKSAKTPSKKAAKVSKKTAKKMKKAKKARKKSKR